MTIGLIFSVAHNLFAQSTTLNICPGELKVLRIGTPEPGLTYVWYKDGEEISAPFNDSIYIDDVGTYRVVAINANGCSSEISEPFVVSYRHLHAMNDWASTTTSTPVIMDLIENDEEGCKPIDPLSVHIVDVPYHGSVEILADGTVVYEAMEGFVGIDTFTYLVLDIEGNYSNIATVIIDVAADNPLYTDLLYFHAIAQEKQALLKWGVGDIDKIAYFEVQRSADAVTFTTVAIVTSDTSAEYIYYDTQPLVGNNYYRIRLIGYDGQVQRISLVRLLRFEVDQNVEVYPNPTYDIITVRSSTSYLLTSIELVDVNGKVLQTIKPQGNQTEVSLEPYPSGTYFLRCMHGQSNTYKVFKVQKL